MVIPALFSGMSKENILSFIKCMGAYQRKFTLGEEIYDYGKSTQHIGVLLSGEAELFSYDLYHKRTGASQYVATGESFGEEYVFLPEKQSVQVVCTKNCEVLFLNTEGLLSTCSDSCHHHKIFLSNLACLYSTKLLRERMHIRILSCRSTREKLLTFFTEYSKLKDSFTFDMPFNLTRLAGYLNVNRSSMARELSKLKAEHLVELQGRRVTIYYM